VLAQDDDDDEARLLLDPRAPALVLSCSLPEHLTMDPPTPLQFLPLSTSISPSFWHRLTSLKLHHLKLDDTPLPLVGHYTRGRTIHDKRTGQTVPLSGALELDEASFAADRVGDRCVLSLSRPRRSPSETADTVSSARRSSTSTAQAATDRFPLHGLLRNVNTLDEFKLLDKAKLLTDLGDQVRTRLSSTRTANDS